MLARCHTSTLATLVRLTEVSTRVRRALACERVDAIDTHAIILARRRCAVVDVRACRAVTSEATAARACEASVRIRTSCIRIAIVVPVSHSSVSSHEWPSAVTSYPALQLQVYPPSLFVHVVSHPPLFVSHSLMSSHACLSPLSVYPEIRTRTSGTYERCAGA